MLDASNSKLSAETTDANTQIFVPKECGTVDVFYFVGTKEIVRSYVVDNQGIYHNFEMENTPIENFLEENITNNGYGNEVSINGINIHKNNIVEIHFGESYNAITTIGNFFVHYFLNLQRVNFRGLKNVTTVGKSFLEGSPIATFDIAQLPNLRSVGYRFMGYNHSLTGINLQGRNISFSDYILLSNSQLVTANIAGIKTYGDGAFGYCSSLNTLIVDENTSINEGRGTELAFKNCRNDAGCTIFGIPDASVAQAFKEKHANLSNWSIADFPQE